MNELDRKLYELLGDKTLSFGCLFKFKEKFGHERIDDAIARVVSDEVEWFVSRYEYVDSKINHRQYFREGKHPRDKDWRIRTEGQSISYCFGDFDFQEYYPKYDDWIEIIGHEPTIADLHRWMNEFIRWPESNDMDWMHYPYSIIVIKYETRYANIPYDSSLSLLSQSDETKLAIVNLIESYEGR